MNISPTALAVAVFSAIIPVVFWFIIVYRKKRKKLRSRFILTFILAGIGALAFYNYEKDFHIYLNDQGWHPIAYFIVLGVLIEYFKNLVVRIVGIKYFKTIDDVIDLSFASALGFTFFENVVEFYLTYEGFNPDIQGPVQMLKYILVREFFILPIHLFCSGIFGYYYGIGLFGGKEVIAKNRKNFSYQLLYTFSLIIPTKNRFKTVKVMQGTMVSVFFYAFFFTILEIDPTVVDLLRIIKISTPQNDTGNFILNEKLMPAISFAFFEVGSLVLFNLLDRKRRYQSREMLTQRQ
jgi:hypothetical protein